MKTNIENDIDIDFNKLKMALMQQIDFDRDFDGKKEFLRKYLQKETIQRSELLLDTLLNYLMDQAQKKLEKADIELQNKFFESDLRKQIREWAKSFENKLKLEPDLIKYSTDPRLKRGLIAGGVSFISSSYLTLKVFYPTTVIGSIVSGLVTIVLSSYFFRIGFQSATNKAKEKLKEDIEGYLEEIKNQVKIWLNSVSDAFEKDFTEFCLKNGFIIGK